MMTCCAKLRKLLVRQFDETRNFVIHNLRDACIPYYFLEKLSLRCVAFRLRVAEGLCASPAGKLYNSLSARQNVISIDYVSAPPRRSRRAIARKLISPEMNLLYKSIKMRRFD